MQLNKVLKGLLIAIPVLALTACGSTSSSGVDAGKSTDSTSTSRNDSNNQTDNSSNIDVNKISKADQLILDQGNRDIELREQSTLYFEYDKNNIQGAYAEMLQAHAKFLVKNPNVKIMIEGHCDERGTPEYNIALGERRAKSVSKYLTNMGVAKSQISMVSYGEEKPTDKSRTEAGFAKNRRAVLVY
ncbi:MAG: peptidoglycan-associated lipoprotein [Alteromonadaceae bacterium]|jgi:peptidoglycan-associated lipoprotein